MGKVADKIIKDAETSKEQAIKSANEKAEKILKEAEKEAERIREEGKEKAEEAKLREKERILSRIRMDLKTEKLQAKNEIVEKIRKNVKERFREMKWKGEYDSFVENLIIQASETGDEEIIPGLMHNEKVKSLIKKMNKKDKYNFTVSDEEPGFEIGVILKKGNKKINASFGILLDRVMDELMEDIVELLFKGE